MVDFRKPNPGSNGVRVSDVSWVEISVDVEIQWSLRTICLSNQNESINISMFDLFHVVWSKFEWFGHENRKLEDIIKVKFLVCSFSNRVCKCSSPSSYIYQAQSISSHSPLLLL